MKGNTIWAGFFANSPQQKLFGQMLRLGGVIKKGINIFISN